MSSKSWSMGSGVALDVAEGTLLSGVLVIEPTFTPSRDASKAAGSHAKLSVSFLPNSRPRRGPAHLPLIDTRLRIPSIGRRPVWETPRLNDLDIFDDRGTRYEWRSGGSHFRRLEDASINIFVQIYLDPIPDQSIEWLELRTDDGLTARLEPAAFRPVRAQLIPSDPVSDTEKEIVERIHTLIMLKLMGKSGERTFSEPCKGLQELVSERHQRGELRGGQLFQEEVTALCGALMEQNSDDMLPQNWVRFLNAAMLSDGPLLNYAFDLQLPTIDGVELSLDALISELHTWRIYLSAVAGWKNGQNNYSRLHASEIHADDNLGGGYLATVERHAGLEGHEDVVATFLPRLDPHAESLQMTISGESSEVVVDISL